MGMAIVLSHKRQIPLIGMDSGVESANGLDKLRL